LSKGVFTTKVEPDYDDLPEERYHFPRTYLRQVEAVVGDWIVYYEPRRTSGRANSRGGRQAYFATARVTRIERDPDREDHFFAYVADFLEFDHPVPFREGTQYFERALRRPDGGTSKGMFGRAVRVMSELEYDLVLKAGFATTLFETAASAVTAVPAGEARGGLSESDQTPFERPIVERVVRRPFRDAAFAVAVKSAYGNTCAMTGIRIINGGGRAEVQAAHIRPVASGGSDSVRNGLALSGTVHWMFDRGLVSIDDDLTILTAEGHLPPTVTRLFNEDNRLIVPSRDDQRPNPKHVRYHRKTIFKG
jgi:putative restriction endonuclease